MAGMDITKNYADGDILLEADRVQHDYVDDEEYEDIDPYEFNSEF